MNRFEEFEEFRQRQRSQAIEKDSLREVIDTEKQRVIRSIPKRRKKRTFVHRWKYFFRRPNQSTDVRVAWYRNRNYYYILVIVLVLIMLAFCFLPIEFGKVVIEGNKKITTEELLREANVNRPVNVLQLSTSDIERRLTGDVRIESVIVSREWINTIHIAVKERKAVGIVQTDFGFGVLDKTGMVMYSGNHIEDTSAPFISGKKVENALLGDIVMDTDIQRALKYLSCLSDIGWNQISEVNVGNPEQMIAYTRDDIAIRLGAGNEPEEQALLSENMLKDIRGRNLSVLYIDANIGAPYIKLK